MKTIILCAFAAGLMAAPAFADDVNVKPTLLPNESLVSKTTGVACVYTAPYDADADCHPVTMSYGRQGVRQTPLVLASGLPSGLGDFTPAVKLLASTPVVGDDVNAHVQPLPNETVVRGEAVNLVCTVDDEGLMKDCQVANGGQVSPGAAAQAIAMIDHKSHTIGHYHAGQTVKLRVQMPDAQPTPFLHVH